MIINNFSYCPNEILVHILNFLPLEEVAKCRFIDQRFSIIADSGELYQEKYKVKMAYRAYLDKQIELESINKNAVDLEMQLTQKQDELKGRQKLWFGSFVAKIFSHSGFLLKIANLIAKIFPSIKTEALYQKRLQDEVNEIKAQLSISTQQNKISELAKEATSLYREYKKLTVQKVHMSVNELTLFCRKVNYLWASFFGYTTGGGASALLNFDEKGSTALINDIALEQVKDNRYKVSIQFLADQMREEARSADFKTIQTKIREKAIDLGFRNAYFPFSEEEKEILRDIFEEIGKME